MQDKNAVLARLDDRSREVFRVLVDHFIHTKNAAGSQTVVAKLASRLSPATVRHVMARLQEEGLLYAPHRSAGRLPTDFGLRLFVEGLMEVGPLDTALKRSIEGAMHSGMTAAMVVRIFMGCWSVLVVSCLGGCSLHGAGYGTEA